ncbi:MAG: histidine phosphatase family protein [Pseudomonadota bacterium]
MDKNKATESQFQCLLIRHWPTLWNIQNKIQGKSDVPLCEDSFKELKTLYVAKPYNRWRWFSSPLKRARQTAEYLKKNSDFICDQRLRELDFGCWEGHRLQDLRKADKAKMQAIEEMGINMRPPMGETPSEVQTRLLDFLADHSKQKPISDLVLITHKSVLRALLSLALGWDMKSQCPVKIKKQQGYLFTYCKKQENRKKQDKDYILTFMEGSSRFITSLNSS